MGVSIFLFIIFSLANQFNFTVYFAFAAQTFGYVTIPESHASRICNNLLEVTTWFCSNTDKEVETSLLKSRKHSNMAKR